MPSGRPVKRTASGGTACQHDAHCQGTGRVLSVRACVCACARPSVLCTSVRCTQRRLVRCCVYVITQLARVLHGPPTVPCIGTGWGRQSQRRPLQTPTSPPQGSGALPRAQASWSALNNGRLSTPVCPMQFAMKLCLFGRARTQRPACRGGYVQRCERCTSSP